MLSSVTPLQGPSTGGTVVTLLGFDFLQSTKCRFGSVVTTATYFHKEKITCVTPTTVAGIAFVEVTNDGIHYTNHRFIFLFQHGSPTIISYHSLRPSYGPISGNTVVYIPGYHFLDQHFKCRFSIMNGAFCCACEFVCVCFVSIETLTYLHT